MKTWAEIYRGRMNDVYFEYFKKKYGPFIDRIVELSDTHDIKMFAELGCGAANTTKAIVELRPDTRHFCVDLDVEMAQLAGSNLEKYKQCVVVMDDIKNHDMSIASSAIVHSHGVLEHFPDDEIRKIIELQKRNNNILVHYVPTAKYEKPSRGDERLLWPFRWRKICSPDLLVEFNDGYDLIMIWY